MNEIITNAFSLNDDDDNEDENYLILSLLEKCCQLISQTSIYTTA